MPELTLTFLIPTKKVLNANSMPRNTFVKSKMARELRRMGHQAATRAHPDSELSAERVNAVQALREVSNRQMRLTKDAKKGKLNPQEAALLQTELERTKTGITLPDIDYLFTGPFAVEVTICPSTRSVIDPPNVYQTVKHLVDGCTDAGLWEDDNYQHLVLMSFRHGGRTSGKKGYMEVSLHIRDASSAEASAREQRPAGTTVTVEDSEVR